MTARELPVATDMAGVDMRLKPGAIRELHWHLEAEWSFMLAGSARLTAVDQEGRNFIADVGVGDLWYCPRGARQELRRLGGGLREGSPEPRAAALHLPRRDAPTAARASGAFAGRDRGPRAEHLPVGARFLRTLPKKKPVVN